MVCLGSIVQRRHAFAVGCRGVRAALCQYLLHLHSRRFTGGGVNSCTAELCGTKKCRSQIPEHAQREGEGDAHRQSGPLGPPGAAHCFFGHRSGCGWSSIERSIADPEPAPEEMCGNGQNRSEGATGQQRAKGARHLSGTPPQTGAAPHIFAPIAPWLPPSSWALKSNVDSVHEPTDCK